MPPIGTICRYIDGKSTYTGTVTSHINSIEFIITWRQITDTYGNEVSGGTFTCGHRLNEINGRHLIVFSNKKLEDYM